jgi:hypothetical protein
MQHFCPDRSAAIALVLALAIIAVATPCRGDIHLSILPAETEVQKGEEFVVELTVTSSSTAFNTYGATILYDSSVLIFQRQAPLSLQEGPLMVEACGLRFHDFSMEPDSTQVSIGHALLCAGVNVSGPGVVYQLTFEAKYVDAVTELIFADVPEFYDEGIALEPVFATDATVVVGNPSSTPPTTPSSLELSVWPNPFNPQARIRVDVARPGFLELDVFTLAGRHVRTLNTEWQGPGPALYRWDGRSDDGRPVVSGVYVVRAAQGASITTSKITLVE